MSEQQASTDADYQQRLTLAVNEVRSSYDSIARLRHRAAFGSAGTSIAGGADNKRPQAWCEYGFPESVSYSDLYNLFRRNGIAYGVVTKLVGNCWKSQPGVIQGDKADNDKTVTAWEKKLLPVIKQTRMWKAFATADLRRLVGRYSAILLQFKDNKTWDQPVGRGSAIQAMLPEWGGSLKVAEWFTDPKELNYGQPKVWQLTEGAMEGRPGRQLKIHPDRIFILGDYATDAIGFLEPAYNNFISMEKVEGGSGESFLKNAARQIAMNFDANINMQAIAMSNGVKVEDLKAMYSKGARELNSISDSMLITQGANVSTLVANVPDPTPTYSINLQSISASVDIPSKVVVGMQTGERASSEDQIYFNARCQSRRVNDLGPEIEAFIGKLMDLEVIPTQAEFVAVWDDLNEATRGEKLDNATKMTKINVDALSMGQAVFTGNEILEAAGYEPRPELDALPELEEPADPAEEDPNADPEDEDGARTNPAE